MKQKFAHKRTRKRLTHLLKREITKSRDDLRQLSYEYIPDLFLYVTFSPFQSFFEASIASLFLLRISLDFSATIIFPC